MAGARSGDKVRQKTVAYLGPLSVLTFGIEKSVREKAERKAGEPVDWQVVQEKIALMPIKFDEFTSSKKRAATLKTRARLQTEIPGARTTPQEPSILLSQRAPGELEAIARLSQRSFRSTFQQIGPYRYRLRRSW